MARDPRDPGTRDLPILVRPSKAGPHRIGYARKSKDDQELALQVDALKRAGCQKIYVEQVSRAGPRRERKGAHELQTALEHVREGDTFVVWRLDRLGGSVSELIRIVTKDLKERGVQFESLTEKIDTSTAAGNMFFQIAAVFAEYERNLLIERTKAGLAAARARGRSGGRKRKITPAQVRELLALHADKSIPIPAILDRYKIAKATLYKYINAAKKAAKQGKKK